jgi:hypothetical protein
MRCEIDAIIASAMSGLSRMPDEMIGRNTSDARRIHGFGGRDVSIPGEGDRLCEAVACCHHIDDRFFAGLSAAVNLDPAVDHDEECRGEIVLPHDQFVRPQHYGGRRRNDVLHGLRLQSPEDRDAGNDLQIAGRQL